MMVLLLEVLRVFQGDAFPIGSRRELDDEAG